MKKLISILLAIFLISTFTVNATASEEKFEKMKDLNNYWAVNDAYPDYFCGVWTETGSLNNLVVAVLDTEEGNRGKQEILDLIEDDSSVTFTYGDYSRNYLIGVQNSFTRDMFTEIGLTYTAFLDDKSRIELGVIKDKENNPASLKMLEEIKEKYGDVFIIKYVDSYYVDGLVLGIEDVGGVIEYNISPNPESNSPNFLYVAVAVSLLLGVACVFLVSKRRQAFLLKTNTGATFIATPLSIKEVEAVIKNTEIEFPSDLDKKVMKQIENRK